jgi:hypothetical protein
LSIAVDLGGDVALDLAAFVRQVRARHAAVGERIARAAARAGRDPREIAVVAVTKGFGPDAVVAAVAAGISDVGENRVQEARAKKPLALELLAQEPGLAPPIWRLIGHLQSNKAGVAAELFDWIDAVDSLDLAANLSRRALAAGKTLRVLIEVKLAPEETKHGVAPAAAFDLVPAIAALPGLLVGGLMTVGPLAGPARPAFQALALLRHRLAAAMEAPLPHLSMGMSGDFEEAVEEGATLLRLGTALFGPRPGG